MCERVRQPRETRVLQPSLCTAPYRRPQAVAAPAPAPIHSAFALKAVAAAALSPSLLAAFPAVPKSWNRRRSLHPCLLLGLLCNHKHFFVRRWASRKKKRKTNLPFCESDPLPSFSVSLADSAGGGGLGS